MPACGGRVKRLRRFNEGPRLVASVALAGGTIRAAQSRFGQRSIQLLNALCPRLGNGRALQGALPDPYRLPVEGAGDLLDARGQPLASGLAAPFAWRAGHLAKRPVTGPRRIMPDLGTVSICETNLLFNGR